MKSCPTCNETYQDQVKFCPRDGSPLKSQAVPGADPMTGRVLGSRWEVKERIGAGGFGTVYKVFDHTMQSTKALKVFDPRFTDAEFAAQARLRFNREAALLDRLSTRTAHIVNISSLEEDPQDKIFYFTMEFVDGETLAGLLKREGPQPVERVLEITRQVCEALVVAHEDKDVVVHRDLKLWNIMLSQDSAGEDMVKVLDFGIAKITAEHAGPKLTQGAAPGTPGYAPPEQFDNRKIDGRSDLFAMGVVMYGMLTGREPWNGRPILEKRENPLDMLRHVLEGKTIPLSEFRDDVPAPVERVVMKLMAAEPDDRVQSARELRSICQDLMRDMTDEVTTGSLRIVTAENGAHIMVKSGLFQVVAKGSTPWVGRDLVPGVYRVILDDPRFPKVSRKVTVRAGRDVEVDLSTGAGADTETRGGGSKVPIAALGGIAAILVIGFAVFALMPASTVSLSVDEIAARSSDASLVTFDGETFTGTLPRPMRRPQPFTAGLDGTSSTDAVSHLRDAGVRLDVRPAIDGLMEELQSAASARRYFEPDRSDDVAAVAVRILALDLEHEASRAQLSTVRDLIVVEAQQLYAAGDLAGARERLQACREFPAIDVAACDRLWSQFSFRP